MDESTDYSDNTQPFNIHGDYQTIPTNYNEGFIQSWEQLVGETSGLDNPYQHEVSQSDSIAPGQTTSFGFEQQQQQQDDLYQYNQNSSSEEINNNIDYETLIRTKHLYYDPNPQVIRKSSIADPIVYNQNIKVRFLQPPPIDQGPLIIREVRPPQPPPPPPLIIRQRAPPLPSPPPIILRERPPPIPSIMTAQVITKPLPPLPPPPRSVIIEKLPALPPKPRDIIIERWIPYESTQKRKVIVHRAEEPKHYTPPKNVIITYEPVQSRIIRQFERLGVTPADPRNYSSIYGNSLLDTEQLLTQIRELGITEDLSPPHSSLHGQQASFNLDEQNFNYNISSEQQQQQQQQQNYFPTYENLVSSTSYEQLNNQQSGQHSPHGEDLSSQLAQYGMTAESIPY